MKRSVFMFKGKDSFKRKVRARLSKYREDITRSAMLGCEAEFHRLFKPYEVIEVEGNCGLTTGINKMLSLIIGAVSGSSHIYDHDHAQIGIGDSTTGENPAQTDLQAAVNKTYKGMETDYPYVDGIDAYFKASFGAGDANYEWNEWVIKHSVSGKCLNRKVTNFGTKNGGTWTLEIYLELV